MSNKNGLLPYKISSAADMSGNFSSKVTNIQNQDRLIISIDVLSGTATGTFFLQGRASLSVSTVYPKSVGPANEWMNLGAGQAAPASGDTIGWDVGFTGASELRVSYTTTSGTGTCDIWVAGKRS